MPGQYLYSSKIKRRRNHTWNSQLISFFPDIMCLFICQINISSQWQMQSMLLDNSYREQYACPCSTDFSICSYVISDIVSLKIFIHSPTVSLLLRIYSDNICQCFIAVNQIISYCKALLLPK